MQPFGYYPGELVPILQAPHGPLELNRTKHTGSDWNSVECGRGTEHGCSPAEVVEAAEDWRVGGFLSLLAAYHAALAALLQVGSDFRARVVLQERLSSLLQLLHFTPVLQH